MASPPRAVQVGVQDNGLSRGHSVSYPVGCLDCSPITTEQDKFMWNGYILLSRCANASYLTLITAVSIVSFPGFFRPVLSGRSASGFSAFLMALLYTSLYFSIDVLMPLHIQVFSAYLLRPNGQFWLALKHAISRCKRCQHTLETIEVICISK